MKIRFRTPVLPNDHITVAGEITKIDDSTERKVTWSVSIKRQNDEVAISGTTTVSMPIKSKIEAS